MFSWRSLVHCETVFITFIIILNYEKLNLSSQSLNYYQILTKKANEKKMRKKLDGYAHTFGV